VPSVIEERRVIGPCLGEVLTETADDGVAPCAVVLQDLHAHLEPVACARLEKVGDRVTSFTHLLSRWRGSGDSSMPTSRPKSLRLAMNAWI
jgi:hypothetical protein